MQSSTPTAKTIHHLLVAQSAMPGNQVFYAAELATENSYFLIVSTTRKEFDRMLQLHYDALKDDIETYTIGTVNAKNEEIALNNIRMGDWQFTQMV